jgi:hypothetical protein
MFSFLQKVQVEETFQRKGFALSSVPNTMNSVENGGFIIPTIFLWNSYNPNKSKRKMSTPCVPISP